MSAALASVKTALQDLIVFETAALNLKLQSDCSFDVVLPYLINMNAKIKMINYNSKIRCDKGV